MYGYPQTAAATVACETVSKWLTENDDILDEVIFCVFLDEDKSIYASEGPKFFGDAFAIK